MNNKLLGLIGFLTLTAASAQAAGGMGSVGAQIGWGIPNETGVTGGLNFGVTGEYNLAPTIAVGAYLSYQMMGLDPEQTGVSLYSLPMGATVNWYAMPELYLGANAGIVMGVQSDGTDSTTASDISFGGQVGYDFPINAQMSVGAEGKYIYIMTEGDAGSLIQANAQFKFMF